MKRKQQLLLTYGEVGDKLLTCDQLFIFLNISIELEFLIVVVSLHF